MPLPEKPAKGGRAWKIGGAVVLAAAVAAVGGAALLRPSGHSTVRRSTEPAPDAQEQQIRLAMQTAPGDPAPRVALIRYLLSQRRACDAVDAAREAAAQFSINPPVRAALADALFAAGRFPEAVETLRPLARTDPSYRIDLVSALLRDGQRAEAERLLKGLPHLKPADAVRAGKVYLDLFQPEAAAALFQSAAASRLQREVGPYLGLALLLSGRYAEAVKPLTAAAGDRSPAMAHYYLGCALRLTEDPARLRPAEAELRQASEGAPNEGLIQYELALARERLGDWDGARAALEQAVARAPELTEAHRDLAAVQTRLGKSVEAALSRARYLRLEGDARAAVQLLAPIQQKHPDDVSLGLALAEADYEAERYPDTQALLERLRAQAPGDTRVLTDLYNAETALQHYDRALEALDALARLTPKDLEVKKRRAETLQRLQRYPEAEQLLTQLRDQEPGNPARHYDLGVFLRLSSKRPDRLTAAEASLRRALELRPDHAGTHYHLGVLLEETGRHAESVSELRRALDLNPALTDAYAVLGRSYMALGDTATAAEMTRLQHRLTAREAEEKQLALPQGAAPATPQVRLRLAEFYVARGRLRDALRELEAVEHADPRSRPVHRRLEQLYGNTYRFQRQYEERKLLAG